MSGKSYTSGSVRSCGGSVRLGTVGGHEVVLDALYDRKRDNKSVRVLTVLIYVFCVSLAAIMLSLYYVFFWEPKDAHYAQRKVFHTVEKQTSTTPMPTCLMPHTGGSDTTVSNAVTQATPVNIENGFSNNNMNASLSNDTTLSPNTLLDTTLEEFSNDTSDLIGTFNDTGSIT